MKILIKNMVCQRCVSAVQQVLQQSGLDYQSITLGEVQLQKALMTDERSNLEAQLNSLGFELINDRQTEIINKIKSLIIDQIHHTQEQLKTNWSDYLSDKVSHDYKYLSHLFSSTEGITIEQYIIRQKIEKAKEMIRYDQLSLSQIAFQLDYSSVAHLSSQFKKTTGMTPSEFKKIGSRKPLDEV